jgi:CheY-like chemotaxis protein
MLNILLIDDDPDDRDLFKEAVQALSVGNCNIIPIVDGLLALDYLMRRNSFSNAPVLKLNFIVLDLNMPKQDGFETLEKIKQQTHLKNIPVYILTTSWSDTHLNRCRKLGCAGYFVKPSGFEELKASVRKMIGDIN